MTDRDAFYGRRKGRPLSPRRARLMTTHFPALALDIASPPRRRPAELFPGPVAEVRLEIGFGGGEHLLAEASASPELGFIGVEPFLNGMAHAVASIVDEGLRNIRLFGGDAALLLDWLPPGSLAAIDLLFPDPWPKRRHWKRRIVNPANLDRFARVLASGGTFRFASDVEGYTAWTLLHLLAREDFEWTAERADDWRRPFPSWSGTRYEAKAAAAGRKPTYLSFKRR
jgi:tRNA (guanine-N7-)-methyltransferase